MPNFPVYLLVDVSEEVRASAEQRVAVPVSLENIASGLDDAHIDVSLCVITFALEATVCRKLSEWKKNGDSMPEIDFSQEPIGTGGTIGNGIDDGVKHLCRTFNDNKDVHENVAPLLIFITSGSVPTEERQNDFTQCGFGKIIVVYHKQLFLDEQGDPLLDEQGNQRQLDNFYHRITYNHVECSVLSSPQYLESLLDECTSVPDTVKVRTKGWEYKRELEGLKGLGLERKLEQFESTEGIDAYKTQLKEGFRVAANKEIKARVRTATQEANQRVTEAEARQKVAESDARNARNFAREEFENERNAAIEARKKAEHDQGVAKIAKTDAEREKDQARDKVVNAEQKRLVAEQNEKIAIAKAASAKDGEEAANNSKKWAIISLVAVAVIAIAFSSYCVFLAGSSIVAAANANSELAEYKRTFDERVAVATKRAEDREAAATVIRNTADKALQDAMAKQEAADKAFAGAVEEQRAANLATEQLLKNRREVEDIRTVTERDKNTSLELKRVAKEAEARAVVIRQEADTAMTEARLMIQAAVTKEANADNKILIANQEAAVRVAVADEKAKMERERRMGVEAMIKAGAPLQFPLENHERDEKALKQQENVPSQPVSSTPTPQSGDNTVNIPKRTAQEILHNVVWRWCLEKEFGIKDETGKLVGEVTGMPRTGYRTSLQGSPLYDPNYVSLYDPGYVPPLGAFRHDVPYNSLAPTEKTREFWEGRKDGQLWYWEDWWTFRTTTDAKKEELGIPPGHTFSLPRDVLPPHEAKLDQRFLLSQTQVTQELWESVMGNNPSHFKGANRPVESVSWEDCQGFIAKLNEMREELGVPLGYAFTLPREAEWEHACRAGSATPFNVGMVLDSKQANIGKTLCGTSVVGIYPANHWGLHDMHGNVREWCFDGLGYGPLFVRGRSSIADGFYRSLRGGSWSLGAEQSHSAYRGSGNPTRKHDDVGFRLCLVALK